MTMATTAAADTALAASLAPTIPKTAPAARSESVVLDLAGSDEATWRPWRERILAYLELPAPPYTEALRARVVEQLAQLHYFSGIGCNLSDGRLHCTMEPLPMVASAEIRGDLPLVLLREDVRRRLFLRPGTLLHTLPQTLDEQETRLQKFLVNNGYLDAQVHIASHPVPAGFPNQGLALQVNVDIGASTSIRNIAVTGDAIIADAQVDDLYRHTAFLWFGAGRFQPAELADDTLTLTEQLQEEGYFAANARATYERVAKTPFVDVHVHIDAGPYLRMHFAGNQAFSNNDLHEMATFRSAGAVDAIEIDETRKAYLAAYQEKGYDNVIIETETGSEHGLEVTFRFIENAKRKVSRVTFEGRSAIPAKVLQEGLNTHASGVIPNRWVDAWVLDDVQAIRRAYENKGFAAARVEGHKRVLENGTLEAVFTIEEGPQAHLERVGIAGDLPLGHELALRKQVHLQEGPQPWVAQSAITLEDNVRAALANMGYLHAQLTPHITPPSPPSQPNYHLDFGIVAGPQAHYQGLFLRGEVRTRTRVITDEVSLEDGEVLDLVQVSRAQRRLRGLNIFGSLDFTPMQASPQSPNTFLLASVQERDVRTVDVIAAFSTDDLGSLGLTFKDLNALGRGMTWTGELRLGDAARLTPLHIGNVDKLSLNLRAPHPEGLPFDLSLNGGFSYRNYDTFSERLLGGGVAIARVLLERNTCPLCPTITGKLAYQLALTDYEIKDLAARGPGLPPGAASQVTTGRIIPSLAIDTRDAPLDPHRGYAVNLQFEAAQRYLAGPFYDDAASFWRVLTGVQGFVQIAKPTLVHLTRRRTLGGPLVLAMSLQYDIEGPWTHGGSVPAAETYSYGGDFSVRGLATGATSFLLSQAMVQGTMELRFYFLQAGIGTLQIAGFTDFATAAMRTSELFREVTVTAGPALRYVTSVGPLSVAYAWPLVRPPSLIAADVAPPNGRLHISFGYSF